MKKKKWHSQAIKLYQGGMTPSEIAKALGKNYHVVYMLIKRYEQNKDKSRKKTSKFNIYYQKLQQENLIDPIREFLLLSAERKGKTLVMSINKFYDSFKPRLEMIGINIGRTRFYQFIKYFIVAQWGSLEAFENERRGTHKNRQVKGTVKRFSDTIEIDATGISWNGKLYFILLAMDLKSGFIFPPYVVEAQDKRSAKYYNTAITSLDVARYLRDLFIEYGVPKAVKSDHEETLKAEIITRAYERLDVRAIYTKPYNPQQKLIERAIRTIKDNLIAFSKQDFETALTGAISHYNGSPHSFKTYKDPVIPAEVFSGYRESDEETIRKAFMERFERVVINNTITIQKDRYEFYVNNLRLGDYGRNKKQKVIVYRDIDNKTVIDVYDAATGEYLGIANLIHTETTLDSVSSKQLKNKEKRIFKRETKLKEELQTIEEEKQKLQPKLQTTDDLDELLSEIEHIEESANNDIELPDLLELFD